MTTTVTVTATDPYGNTDTSFSGNKTLVFSGATSSPAPATNPTVRDRQTGRIVWGDVIVALDGPGLGVEVDEGALKEWIRKP